MLSKLAHTFGFSYELQEDSPQVNSKILAHLDRLNILHVLCDQQADPITFRYKADTLSLTARKNNGQSAFPRINVKYLQRRKEIAQFVLEIRDTELTVKQYNAPPVIRLNALQKLLKVHRKTKANAALFFLTRIIDRTQDSDAANKMQRALTQLSDCRYALARLESVPANSGKLLQQTAVGLNLVAHLLKRLERLETPGLRKAVISKLTGLLDTTNRASDTILTRLAHYPALKPSVRTKPVRRALRRVSERLANTPAHSALVTQIDDLSNNLEKFEKIKNR